MIKKQAIEEIIDKYWASLSGQMIGALVIFGFINILQIECSLFFVWWLLLLLVMACRYVLFRQLKQSGFSNLKTKSSVLKRLYINVFFVGVLWGGIFLLLIINSPSTFHFFSMALAAVLLGAAVLTLGSSFLIYALFAIPMASLLIIGLLIPNDTIHYWSAFATLAGTLYLIYVAKIYASRYLDLIIQNEKIQETQYDLVNALGKAAEYRDEETGEHVLRMSHACYQVALALGYKDEEARFLQKAASMHDIGKIGISDGILLKPGKLTPNEYQIMQQHCQIGLEILTESDSPLITMARTVIAGHHECWDGSGYPNGLSGEAIAVEARIAAVCDVFDALVSVRPYKKAWPFDEAFDFICQHSGSRFDPAIVKAFKEAYPEIKAYDLAHQDSQKQK